jgi:hypothetical protein
MENRLAAFVSIPKCASKTILSMFDLGRNRDDDRTCKQEHHIIYENHQRLCVLEKRYNLDQKFVFTFVRNPYTRVVSWFYYHKHKRGKYKNLTLSEWIQQGCPSTWTRQNATDWQAEALTPLLQRNFTAAEKKVDFVGKLENFEEDCQRLVKILNQKLAAAGFTKRLTYRNLHANKVRTHPEERVLTQEDKDKIYELFQRDFEEFGYPRERPPVKLTMRKFLSYGNKRFVQSRERIRAEACRLNIFRQVKIETDESIRQDPEFDKALSNPDFRRTMRERKGGGFYLWKPYILYKHLRKLPNHGVLVYCDAGCTIPNNRKTRAKLKEFIKVVQNHPSGVLSFEIPRPERVWTKSDIFEHFGCVDESLTHSKQREAGRIHVVRKCEASLNLYRLWWETARDHPLLFDNKVRSGVPNLSGFRQNRNDQSVWSVLCKQHNIPAWTDRAAVPILATRIRC